eukprot:gene28071-31174_t
MPAALMRNAQHRPVGARELRQLPNPSRLIAPPLLSARTLFNRRCIGNQTRRIWSSCRAKDEDKDASKRDEGRSEESSTGKDAEADIPSTSQSDSPEGSLESAGDEKASASAPASLEGDPEGNQEEAPEEGDPEVVEASSVMEEGEESNEGG